jgi:hypothetical protein
MIRLTNSVLQVFLTKLIVRSAGQEIPEFMDPEGEIPCWQKFAIGSYQEPFNSSP